MGFSALFSQEGEHKEHVNTYFSSPLAAPGGAFDGKSLCCNLLGVLK